MATRSSDRNRYNTAHIHYTKEHEKNSVITSMFTLILGIAFGTAFWFSLTQTLDQQTRVHCMQGWQRACEDLK